MTQHPAAEREDGLVVACLGCGGPHQFDTSIASPLWNRVIRDGGLPDYLCTTCIVLAFVKAGESFDAELYGDAVNRDDRTVPVIHVQVDDRPLDQSYGDLAYRLRAADNRSDVGLRSTDATLDTLEQALRIADRARWQNGQGRGEWEAVVLDAFLAIRNLRAALVADNRSDVGLREALKSAYRQQPNGIEVRLVAAFADGVNEYKLPDWLVAAIQDRLAASARCSDPFCRHSRERHLDQSVDPADVAAGGDHPCLDCTNCRGFSALSAPATTETPDE